MAPRSSGSLGLITAPATASAYHSIHEGAANASVDELIQVKVPVTIRF